jgi:hypothetical protein
VSGEQVSTAAGLLQEWLQGSSGPGSPSGDDDVSSSSMTGRMSSGSEEISP